MPDPIQIPPGQIVAAPAQNLRDNWRGLRWMMLSVLGSSAMTIGARVATWELDSRLVVMYRAVLTTVALAILLALLPRMRAQMRFSVWGQHLVRGALIAFSTHLGFYTIATIPLATTTVLFFTAPIFATLLALLIHGEKVGPRRIGAMAAGFTGVLVILRPGFDTLELGLLTALGSSLMFALALNMSRKLAETDGPVSTFASSVVITAVLSLPIAAPVMAPPTLAVTWVALAAVVATGAIRSVADIQAYRHAEAAILAPVTYLRLVFIGTAGIVFFGEVIDLPTVIGAIIIVGSTLYIALREAALRKAQKA